MTQKKPPAAQGKVGVKISDEVHRGVYANQLVVAHSREEFVLDFLVTFPPGAQVVARVITSPGHLKRITRALVDNLSQYEQQYGTVDEATGEPPADPAHIN